MNQYLKLIYFIEFLIISFLTLKRPLFLYQQNRYDNKRYFDWLNANHKLNLNYYLLFLFLLLIVYFFNEIAFIVILLVTIALSYKDKNKVYIKPLVLTSRVKRQAVVLLLLDILLYFFIPLKVIFMIVIFMNYLLLFPMGLITSPIESLVRKHYKNLAKEILDQRQDLIKVGITGSFGKTSSKNVLQEILTSKYYSLMTPKSFNTPMGLTITIRNDLKRIHQAFICEMGADHVGDIKELMNFIKPNIGIVTSIGPQHLNTFGSLENIINEKMLEIEMLPENGLGIINYDNEHIKNYKIKNKVKVISIAIDCPADFRAINLKFNNNGSTFDVLHNGKIYHFQTVLLGKHNISNILLAIACGFELGISWSELQNAVATVKYIEHRLELKKINGLNFIDNAFNSNPTGSKMSLDVLKGMDGKRVIVTPGMIDLGSKQAEINKEFGKYMLNRADYVLLIGKNQTEPIYQGLKEASFDLTRVLVFDKVLEALDYVYHNFDGKDTILLENDLPDAFNN